MDETQIKQYYSDFATQFSAESVSVGSHDGQPLRKAEPFQKLMHKTFGDSVRRNRVQKAINSFLLAKLGTDAVGALLTAAVSERGVPFIRDESTQFLNMMEAFARPDLIVDDWIYRISERRQGTTYASNVNPEGTLTTGVDSVYRERTNTLAFWGDKRSATFVGNSITKQQRGIDLLKNEIQSERIAIRRAKNRDYIQSQEQKVFVPPAISKVGGILERSTTNTDTAGAGDISETLLETNLAKIDNVIGTNYQKVMFTNSKTCRVFRDVEIDRYGGSNVITSMQMTEIVRSKMAEYKVMPTRYYESAVSGLLPLVREIDLPSGVSFCITADPELMPLEAKFLLDGMMGEWVFVRPVEELRELVFIMDGGTLDDPAEDTHFVISNHL